MYFQGNGIYNFTIGRNMGWGGFSNTILNGSVSCNSLLHVTAATKLNGDNLQFPNTINQYKNKFIWN